MSDEPTKLPEGVGPASTPTGIYEHCCEHDGCSKWGGFGFTRMKLETPRWYCFEHRDEGERYL